MEDILIRRANRNDIDVLLQFEQGVIEAERPYDSTLKPGLIHYYDLERLIRSEDSVIMVAENNNELIGSGYALIKPAEPYLVHERYAYLGFMFVRPDYRGRGVNASIINELKNWCMKKRISEIRLEVYADNVPAILAYQKAGFSKNMLEMRLNLGTGYVTG